VGDALLDLGCVERRVAVRGSHVIAYYGYYVHVARKITFPENAPENTTANRAYDQHQNDDVKHKKNSYPSSTASPCVYLVLEYSDRGSLDEFLRIQARPAVAAAPLSYVLRGVLLGLQSVHAAGLRHGELSPRCVFLNSRGVVKVGGLLLADMRRAALRGEEHGAGSEAVESNECPAGRSAVSAEAGACWAAAGGGGRDESKRDLGARRRRSSRVGRGGGSGDGGCSPDSVADATPAETRSIAGAVAAAPCSSSLDLGRGISVSTTTVRSAISDTNTNTRNIDASALDAPMNEPDPTASAGAGPVRPHWLPPEATPLSAPSSAADTWALGVLMLQLAAGQPTHAPGEEQQSSRCPRCPRACLTCSCGCLVWALVRLLSAPRDLDADTVCCAEASAKTSSGSVHERAEEVLRSLPQSFADMAAQCLSRDPRGRPSVGALLRHPFVAEYSGYGQRDFQRWMNHVLRSSL
jgi:serine/threonine protein kinase